MIPRPTPERFRLRRTMMFMNAQKPRPIKDAYIYGVDSIMLDLEDAVAENQKDAARFSLYHALKTIDYGDTEVIVRINGLDTPHWQEDIRVCVAGGADGIRIAKCESAQDVKIVEEHVEKAEREFGVEVGRTLLMAALESPKGIMNAYETRAASDRMFGVAISAAISANACRPSLRRTASTCCLHAGRCCWPRARGWRAVL
ncbi:MAG: aldolase/citrate lyase family protein [Christensenellales bacterium]